MFNVINRFYDEIVDDVYDFGCDIFDTVDEGLTKVNDFTKTSGISTIVEIAASLVSIVGTIGMLITNSKAQKEAIEIQKQALDQAKIANETDVVWQAEETAITVISLINNPKLLQEVVKRHVDAYEGENNGDITGQQSAMGS